MRKLFLTGITIIALTSFSGLQSPAPIIHLKFIAEGFTGPVAMGCPKDGSGRIFICEQTGKIKVIKSGKLIGLPFLDVGSKLSKVNKGYSEKGLLGIAFHPKYKSNGRFFIYYSAPSKTPGSDHKSIIAEYKADPRSDVAIATSERIILEIEEPESNHNGGQLAFGPDGFLYIGVGDGGGAGDKHGTSGNGQLLSTHLGKILRIDVDGKLPYAIPSSNPFVSSNNVKPEIWAYGLRNPWRFSFDSKTGRLFCGDVGQDKYEEVDIIEKGKNYGWRLMEGNHCYNPSNCNTTGITLPIAEYDHATGICITGGYVYNGESNSALKGKYVFGDWKGYLFYLDQTNGKYKLLKPQIDGKQNNDVGININSFGEDEDGEIYILGQSNTGTYSANGAVYMISGI